ncbi:MAG: nuclease-related domain-containing protein [Thermodesulfobacteriota bacterium]|jgi:hypothetical protein
MKKASSKSPLKEPLLRLPGQSIDEQMDRLFDEKLLSYLLFALVFFLLASFGWIQALNQSRLNPWFMSIVAAPVIAYCAFRIWQTMKEVKRLKLGRDGERAVAEQLDVLKRQGAIVFHDLIGDGFNLDHVVLSGQGVFVVETKTRSKPAKGSPTVTFDGKTLLVNGLEPERNPVTQAQANARWLAQMLRASTGKEFPIRPVVLFPGWFVEPSPKGSTVWVLHPQALPSFIEHEPDRISESDLHLAAFHLARYIRAHAQGFSPKTP